jgi:dGTPase
MSDVAIETRHHRYHKGYTEDKVFEFAKDYDHLLYSSAFRRLSGVTQVVNASETALFHNRLTHSLKVAQVGRRLVKAIYKKIDDETDAERSRLENVIAQFGGGLDSRVVHAACIAHDLGHPPFGHIAEQALQQLLSGTPDGSYENNSKIYPHLGNSVELDDSFEGNAQSFRIVTKLAFRESYNERNAALNLTRATLAALLKYPWANRNRPDGIEDTNTFKKWGFYDSEREFFNFAREGLIVERVADAYSGPKKELRTIEAQVMDWADDISYAIHDVEDFFRAGLIPLDVLGQSERVLSEFFDYAWERVEKHFVRASATENKKRQARLEAETWLDEIKQFLPPRPYEGSRTDREALHDFASIVIKNATSGLEITDQGLLLPQKRDLAIIEMFKQLTWFYVIDRPSLSSGQHGQVYLIRELFRDLTSWVWQDYEARRKGSTILPPRLKEYVDIAFDPDKTIGSTAYPSDEHRIRRAVVDYIVSLTETQAVELAARLHGRTSRSVMEGWFHM